MNNPFTICQSITAQLINNKRLQDFCKQNFGRDLYCQIGFDVENEPGLESTPLFCISPATFVPDRTRSSRSMIFKCAIAIKGEKFKFDVSNNYNTCSSIPVLFEFYNMVEELIMSWGNDNYINSHAIVENSMDIALPFVRAFFSYTVQEDY